MELVKTNNQVATRKVFQKGVEWILADDSGSMRRPVPGITPRKSRIDCLNEAIAAFGPEIQTISFGTTVHKHIGPTQLTGYADATKLAPALEAVLEYEPNYIIVISDGRVHDEQYCEALASALAPTCIIDTLYIGGDDPIAIGFMSRLAEIGNGRFKRYDITKSQTLSLGQAIQLLLPAPQEVIEQ